MLLALGTFGLVLGIIFGVYWLLVMRPEMAQEAALRARIGEKSGQGRQADRGTPEDARPAQRSADTRPPARPHGAE